MKLLPKIIVSILILGIGVGIGTFVSNKPNTNEPTKEVAQEQEFTPSEVMESQRQAKAKREEVAGVPYYSNQEYYDAFIGMNVNDLIYELEQGTYQLVKGEIGVTESLTYEEGNGNQVIIDYEVDTKTIDNVNLKEVQGDK
ncbi:hypothetical protein CHL78_012100 [Romboutsia weinsteinii]|uniref:Uncharacterized protein n=1 Tax=Romboutsia weinsteinii TaxID=2020949 RepID=A0A371J2B7_9FIRM|nr:hypothetical protein [Romboutsia weinsteinii]RDY26806.1 hypothetical protein CHL78_012100 [Romboutsia weinsteinii]